MGYVDDHLTKDEIVVARARLHWIVFVWPALCAGIGLLLLSGEAAAAGWLFLALAVLSGVPAALSYATSEFALTTKRVLVKTGWIRRRSFEVLLSKVEGIGVDQGILGRILGYGAVVVTGTGGSHDAFQRMTDPMAFRRAVQEQIG
jgi:uncharacterized membrane protein YdbT with pleckstrin-like domain